MAEHNLINLLPSDLLFDNIFSRIPIKTVVQCRLVAKPWLHFLTEAFVLRLHCKYDNSLKLLICHYNQLYLIHHESLHKNGEINLSPSENIPFKDLVCWGSCNGLLYIGFTCRHGKYLLGLWNPFTGEFINLPAPNPSMPYGTVFGFGFNPTNKDYVVVAIVPHARFKSTINIFSLAKQSWKPSKYIRYGISRSSGKSGVLVSGALHWVARCNLLIALKIGSEEVQEIPKPRFEGHNAYMEVAELGGELCLVCRLLDDNLEFRVEAWVMKDYGVSSSWMKLFKIKDIGDQMPKKSLIPICLTKDDAILIHVDGVSLVLYDPREEELIYIKTGGVKRDFKIVTFAESLVEIKHGQNKEYLSSYF